MGWTTVLCPECGHGDLARTPGGATANWRAHFIAVHLPVFAAEADRARLQQLLPVSEQEPAPPPAQ